jgi:hypothetical protein
MIDHDVTCAEKMRLGEEIANDQTYHSMERQGRPLTNVEMDAFVYWKQRMWERTIKRDGCCGGEIRASGRCPQSGRMCPLYEKARKIEWQTFHTKPEEIA